MSFSLIEKRKSDKPNSRGSCNDLHNLQGRKRTRLILKGSEKCVKRFMTNIPGSKIFLISVLSEKAISSPSDDNSITFGHLLRIPA